MKDFNRRDFIKTIGTASAAAFVPGIIKADAGRKMIWGNLLHLSMNMWEDWNAPGKEMRSYYPYLRFDEKLWNDLLTRMASAKMNMVVIDLGDGVQYERHPEIAVKNAWTVEKLRSELKKIRDMGMEPIPKLNFASSHDAWMGKYSRCLSTEKYYQVCADLIAEVSQVFDRPRFFHLGMDEETAGHQKYYKYVTVRQFDLWWHDFLFLSGEVQKAGVRPWIWSDYLWRHPEVFFEKMPKEVLQSNWYYGTKFGDDKMVKAYDELDAHGYDQIPAASNHSHKENFSLTVDYCKKHIQPSHLFGFLQTPWRPTIEEFRQHHLEAIDVVEAVIAEAR
jgi:hypothetical protein